MTQQAPDHAVKIWLDGENIHIQFADGFGENDQTHTVVLDSGRTETPSEADAWALVERLKREERDPSSKPMPAVRGWAALRTILKERAQAHRQDWKIGHQQSITQFQLDQMVRNYGGEIKVVGKKRTVENVSLEELGL